MLVVWYDPHVYYKLTLPFLWALTRKCFILALHGRGHKPFQVTSMTSWHLFICFPLCLLYSKFPTNTLLSYFTSLHIQYIQPLVFTKDSWRICRYYIRASHQCNQQSYVNQITIFCFLSIFSIQIWNKTAFCIESSHSLLVAGSHLRPVLSFITKHTENVMTMSNLRWIKFEGRLNLSNHLSQAELVWTRWEWLPPERKRHRTAYTEILVQGLPHSWGPVSLCVCERETALHNAGVAKGN